MKYSKKSLPRPVSRIFPPMFSSKSCMPSGLKFRPFIHFELIKNKFLPLSYFYLLEFISFNFSKHSSAFRVFLWIILLNWYILRWYLHSCSLFKLFLSFSLSLCIYIHTCILYIAFYIYTHVSYRYVKYVSYIILCVLYI